MPAAERTNPAQRLHGLLSELLVTWQAASNQAGHHPLRQVFRTELADKIAPDAEFLALVGEMVLLPGQVLDALDAVKARELQWAREHLEAIQDGLGPKILTENLSSHSDWLNNNRLLALQAGATALNAYDFVAERVVPLDALAALVGLTRDARNALSEDESLDGEFKTYVTDLLAEVERAVVHYQVGGVQAFERLLYQVIGHLGTDPGIDSKGKRTKTWPAVKRLMAGIAAVVNFSSASVALATNDNLPWRGTAAPEEVVNCLPDRPAIGVGQRELSHAEADPAETSSDEDRSADSQTPEPGDDEPSK